MNRSYHPSIPKYIYTQGTKTCVMNQNNYKRVSYTDGSLPLDLRGT